MMEPPLPSSSVAQPSPSASSNDGFDAEPRGRCYTWPMQQYEVIYEELPLAPQPPMQHPRPSGVAALLATPGVSQMGSHLMPLQATSNPYSPYPALAPHSASEGDVSSLSAPPPPKKKRCRKKPADQLAQKKPNPWGEESYSDLIAKALEESPDRRMKLNEIYQWFAENIQYFRDRSSPEEAAGWKNSIRHNLSLHSRFMRIQNEGAGKSSWWVINPDAKPGRNPRRQRANTLESTNKAAIEKKRRGARKKVMEARLAGSQGLHSTGSSVVGSQASIISHELYGDTDDGMGPHGAPFEPMFRPRTQSNLSVPGSSSRVSPQMEQGFDDFDFPPWVDAATNPAHPIPSDILDRTDQMRLADAAMETNSPAYRRPQGMQQQSLMNGRNGEIKHEPKMIQIKQEPGVAPPPSYHELNAVRGPQQLQNPLLRTQLQSQMKMQPVMNPPMNYYGQQQPPPMYGQLNQGGWPVPTTNGAPPHMQVNPHSCAASSQASVSSSALPVDLENLSLPDQPLMEMDMEALLRHELSQTRDNQLNFDI